MNFDTFVMECAKSVTEYWPRNVEEAHEQNLYLQGYYLYKFQFVWDPILQKMKTLNSLFGVEDMNMDKITQAYLEMVEKKDVISKQEITQFNDLTNFYKKNGNMDFLGTNIRSVKAKSLWNMSWDPQADKKYSNFATKHNISQTLIQISQIPEIKKWTRSEYQSTYSNEDGDEIIEDKVHKFKPELYKQPAPVMNR